MRVRVPIRALLAVVLALAAGTAAPGCGGKGGAAVPRGGPRPLLIRDIVTVAPGVHLLGRTFPNAAYLVETSEGPVLVDTCQEEDAGPIRRQMRALGADPARLRAILLTHVHGDHSLGAPRLRTMSGATVCAGRGDAEVLREGTSRDAFFSMYDMDAPLHPVPVDRVLDGDEVIEVGEARFRVIATPGHTPGSVCYLLEKDGLRILFTGDTIISLTDSGPDTGPGIYSAYLSPRYRGDLDASLASMRRLLSLPVPDLVLPGHPAADPVPQDPGLSRERWTALLLHAVERLGILKERYAADGADFLDGTVRDLLPGLRYKGEIDGRALYSVTAQDGRRYLFDAPGGERLPAVLRERCPDGGPESTGPAAVLLTSCAPEATSGLASLVGATGCTVVAPREGIAGLAKRCPEGTRFEAAEAWAAKGALPLEVLPVEGRGPAVAYVLEWKGRRVVIPGTTPTIVTAATGEALGRSLEAPGADRDAYNRSLDALAALAPDLWLPAVPVHEQNANVYDGQWRFTVDTNRAR